MSNDVATAGKARARGLERAFDILDHIRLRRQPLRPNEIATGISAPRSSVYEVVNVLLDIGVLEKADAEGRVYLGRKLYFLGTAYAENFDLGRECETLLQKLAQDTRETAQMCMLDGNKYAVAMMKEGVRPFRISSDVGEPVPLPWTASGRLLVMHMSDQQILDFIPPEDFVLPNGELLDRAEYVSEVRRAQRDGFCTFDSITDTFTHCFAVPVYQPDGRVIATLCLVVPRDDARRNRIPYIQALTEAASTLSSRMGTDPAVQGGDTTGHWGAGVLPGAAANKPAIG